MLDFLYTITIAPLEILYACLFRFLVFLTDSYPLALVGLSAVSMIVFHPLKNLAGRLQQKEQKIQAVLAPQLAAIKAQSSGAEKQARIAALYRRYAYHPVFALRSSLGLALQVPFLCAAYSMLNEYEPLKGQSLGSIEDLSQPDRLLGGINLLPLLMTAINLLAVYTRKDVDSKGRKQAILLALVFLALLYAAPSALLVYWTCNNIFSVLESCIPLKENNASEKRDSFFRRYFSLRSPALSLPLVFLAPALFRWSQNWYRYDSMALTVSLVLAVLIVTPLFFTSAGCCELIGKTSGFRAGRILFYGLTFLFCCAFASAIWLAWGTLFTGYFSPAWLTVRLVQIGLIILTAWALYVFGVKTINRILLAFACISCLTFVYDVAKNKEQSLEVEHITVELKKNPNIFLFLLESFHDTDYQFRTFGIESSALLEYLDTQHFVVYDNVFANSPSTLLSTADLFAMKHLHSASAGVLDVVKSVHLLIAGSADNPLFVTMKNNGYKTVFLGGEKGNDFLKVRGPFIDETDIGLDATLFLLQPVFELHDIYFKAISKLLNTRPHISPIFTGTLRDRLQTVFDRKTDSPLFVFYYGGALHTPGYPEYSYTKRDEWIHGNLYQEGVQTAVAEIKQTVDVILHNDPDALIVLIGDHGTHLLRNLITPETTVASLQKVLRKENLSIEDVAENFFGVFLAIRMPEGKCDISAGLPMSHVNIFRHIFAALNNDLSILATREPSLSVYHKILLARDGRAVLEQTSDMR
jgi:Preprotein translocase subunit YidC